MARAKRRLRGLSEHSIFYKENAAVYEEFSKAEASEVAVFISLKMTKQDFLKRLEVHIARRKLLNTITG